MRIVVVSDIHSNLEALQAVLGDARTRGPIDAIWNAGDTVGYGPQPSEVIAALNARGAMSVAGNHDLAACGRSTTAGFNRFAALAANWTAEVLSVSDGDELRTLPLVRVQDGVTIVHGSLRAPDEEYLLEPDQAHAHFDLQVTQLSIVGHTHLPLWFEQLARGGIRLGRAVSGETLDVRDSRFIFNPGSVGQPRDGDPRAGYAIYDTAAGTVTWWRVAYDIEIVQRKMRSVGLPAFLIERLSKGW